MTTSVSAPSAYRGMIESAASSYNVPAGLVSAVISAESSFNPNAKSSAGAGGLMQLIPSTAKGLGVSDVYDPQQNITAGTKYLGQLISKYGDYQLALAAYNWGPGNVDKAIKKYGANWSSISSHAPAETRKYVNKVMSNWG
jgi:soluble lytic murein transglycosylase-like protein